MRIARFDHLLAGSAALALTLALTPYSGSAFGQSTASVTTPAGAEAAAPAATSAAPAKPEVTSSIPAAGSGATPAADTAMSEKLRELLASGKADRQFGGRKERGAVEAFYQSRGFAPLWISGGTLSDRGKAVAGYLAGVNAHGFEPSEYPLPEVRAGADATALAEAELKFTDSVLTYARHALTGRVHYSRIAADIEYKLERPEPADVLGKLAGLTQVADVMESFQPQHPAYKALKAKLAEARGRKEEAQKARIPDGPLLRYRKDPKGKEVLMQDPRVPLLRERLGVTGDASNTTFDKELADAVTRFQKERGLKPTGVVGPQTVEAINGPRRDRDADVIVANLERWRWVPRELGKIHVMLNIPDFSLRIMRDGKVYWQTRVVVGKPSQATPIISAEMRFITVNPTWNVPPSIIQHEYLPAMQQDGGALERMGIKVAQDADGTVRMWQPPGDRNALGRIRFNFPNRFLVYQHDTPDKHLFKHERRAYSHGCMRVEDPLKYGEMLLSLALPNEKYTAEKLRSMYGPSEININFPTTIPVHLTYQTAFVDDQGKLVIRDDVYGRDQRLLAVLKGPDRRVADVPMDRPRQNFSAPVRVTPGSVGGPTGFSGPSFFDRLFGAAPAAAAPARPAARVGRANDRSSVR